MSMQLPDGRTLTMETHMVDVSSDSPVRDTGWTFTDAQGHDHHATPDGDYPTLRWVVDQEPYTLNEGTDDDPVWEEYPGWGHYECAICGEHITPDVTYPPPIQSSIAGSRAYYLDGVPITPDEAQALVDAARGTSD